MPSEDKSPPTNDANVGKELAADSSEVGSILGHAYRGELDRETTWRTRLDQTTSWGVTVVAAILTWAFSSPDNPHYILLVGMFAVTLFLGIEARRYRDYDVYRSRVRLYQQNLLADVLDPSQGLEHEEWREELSRDYRLPTLKVTVQEAVGNRLRRIYLPVLVVLLIAWVFRITAFSPGENPIRTASVAVIPGGAVLVSIGMFYVVMLGLGLWPRERKAKGEFKEGDPGEWKRPE